MIEVDVGQEDLRHVFRGDAVVFEAPHQVAQAGRRARLDDRGRVLAQEKERGDNLLRPHETKVYRLYLHLPTHLLCIKLREA